MAAAPAPAPPPPPATAPTAPARHPAIPDPSRSPLPLSAAQEAQVQELYHKRVRNKCADEVRDFAACCQAQPFTATFRCRAPQKRMNGCMLRYATQAEKDAARAEWFATMDRRRQEREAREARRREDERFWRLWWDKDVRDLPSTEGRDVKGRHVGGGGGVEEK